MQLFTFQFAVIRNGVVLHTRTLLLFIDQKPTQKIRVHLFRSSFVTCSKSFSKSIHSHGRIEVKNMAAQNKISHQVGEFQNDVFRFDIHGVKSDIVGSHPLETLCQSVNFSSFLLFPFNSHYFPLNSIKYYSRISLAKYIYIF